MKKSPNNIIIACSLCILVLAIFGFFGHLLNFTVLASARAAYIPMAQSTAACFIVLVLVFTAYARGLLAGYKRAAAIFLISGITLFGFLKFIEYFIMPDSSFENIFVESKSNLGDIPVNIMSHMTGFNFCLAGMATLFILLKEKRLKHPGAPKNIAGILGVIVSIIAFTFILGYIYGHPLLYSSAEAVPMAITTAIAFLLSGIALVSMAGDSAVPLVYFAGESTSARLLRIFVPLVVSTSIIQSILQYFVFVDYAINNVMLSTAAITVFALLVGIIISRIGFRMGETFDRVMLERNKALEDLKISELRFREIFENMYSGVALYEAVDGGEDFIFKDFNHAAERLSRVKREDVLGRRVSEVFPGVKDFGLFRVFQNVWRTGRAGYLPAALYKDQRLSAWYENYVYKLPCGELVVIYTDISEQKRRDELLRESEAKYQDLYDNAPDMFASVDLKTKNIIECNNAFLRNTGYSKEELVGKSVFGVYFDGDLCEAKKIYDQLLNSGSVHNKEIRIKRKDGSMLDVSLNASVVHDDKENILYSRSIYRDVTERKIAEENLRDYHEHLEKEVRKRTEQLSIVNKELEIRRRLSDIGQLSASLAHELRNPLGAIKIAAYNIRRKRQNALLDSHLENIDKKIAECDLIIKNFLNYAKLNSPAYESTDIHSVLEECISGFKKKYIAWEVDVKMKSNCGRGLLIEADSLQINELFSNLLDNAYQSFEDKKGSIAIELSCCGKENRFVIIFSDNGSGIEEEKISMVFEPFFTTKVRGMGLGLTVCKQIVDLHKGTINIESEKDKGTTVSIGLPLKKDL